MKHNLLTNAEEKKYPREVLIFNMCFIVSKQMAADWVYEPLVQKCAEYLQELEKVYCMKVKF